MPHRPGHNIEDISDEQLFGRGPRDPFDPAAWQFYGEEEAEMQRRVAGGLPDPTEGFVPASPGVGGPPRDTGSYTGQDEIFNLERERSALNAPLDADDTTKKGWGALTPYQRGALGANVGAGLGRGVAGLIAMFKGQPHALIDAYRRLSEAYKNLDDPEIQKQVWAHPVIQQIARYQPELIQDFHESMADFEDYEGDAEFRAKEAEALATVTERARRGDPEAQRLQTREAAAGVGRQLARAGSAAQAQAARRGMPGAMVPGMAQAGAQYAAQVGSANVLASRRSQETAEARALQGAMGVRQGRESQGQMAANLRNNFRNAMSNRQLSVSIQNQKARQGASDQQQRLAQSVHERNLLGADQRRRENQRQQNVWERDEYSRDRQRLVDTGALDIGIAREQDAARTREDENLGGVLAGLGQLGGGLYGLNAG